MQIFQLLIVPNFCCVFISPLDIEFEDEEEDEDKIIEQRRKQREELLKVMQILNILNKEPIGSKHFFLPTFITETGSSFRRLQPVLECRGLRIWNIVTFQRSAKRRRRRFYDEHS